MDDISKPSTDYLSMVLVGKVVKVEWADHSTITLTFLNPTRRVHVVAYESELAIMEEDVPIC